MKKVAIGVSVLLMIVIFVAMLLSLLPRLADMRRMDKEREGDVKLHQLDLALESYCCPPVTKYPSDLSMLSNDVSPEMFVCPVDTNRPGSLTNVMEWMDYIYVLGQSPQTPPGVPILICPPERHKGRYGCVLSSDHSIKVIPAAEIDCIITNLLSPTSGYSVVVSKRLTEQSHGKYRSKP